MKHDWSEPKLTLIRNSSNRIVNNWVYTCDRCGCVTNQHERNASSISYFDTEPYLMCNNRIAREVMDE